MNLFRDSNAAISIGQNQVQDVRPKHEVDHHYIREKLEAKKVHFLSKLETNWEIYLQKLWLIEIFTTHSERRA